MSILVIILAVLAFVLFLVAAFGVSLPRVHFGWLALAVLTLAFILTTAGLTT